MDIKLIQGECLQEMDKLISEGVKVDYSFTSPPYNRKRNDKYSNFDDRNENWFLFNSQVIDKLLLLTKNYVFVYNLSTLLF